MFSIREVPQASTGVSPFELLYGRRPRGMLDIAKEAWEEQPSPPSHDGRACRGGKRQDGHIMAYNERTHGRGSSSAGLGL